MRVLLAVFGLLLSTSSWAKDVTFKASDGVDIHAVHKGSGEKGVVLIHDAGRTSKDWDFFADKIAGSFSVLQIDLRGHGTSGLADKEELSEEDYLAMVQDVLAASKYLQDKGAGEITLVGAQMGGNIALNAGAQDDKIVNLIMLTPGLNQHGHKVSTGIGGYGERPLLLVASNSDSRGARAADQIANYAKGEVFVELLPEEGTGVKLLNTAPSLHGTLVAWINQTFRVSRGEGSNSDAELESSGVGNVETSGVLLEDRGKKKDEPIEETPPE
jgi:pimeloyl-ACP methyl ester carboxylesterase